MSTLSAQVRWACGVVKAGKPAHDLPVGQKVEAYQTLAIAYGVLAGQALTASDLDRYLEYSELSEQADAIGRLLRAGVETPTR